MTLLATHVLTSLIALALGALTVQGLIAGRSHSTLTAWFLAMTALTCISGLLLPLTGVTPPVAVAILALVVVSVAAYARFGARAAGARAVIFAITTVVTEYFNTLVLVAQAFKHVPPLTRLAPTGAEPPVAITQLIVLAAFVVLGVVAARRFPADRAGSVVGSRGATTHGASG
jgi:hypothetical protein